MAIAKGTLLRGIAGVLRWHRAIAMVMASLVTWHPTAHGQPLAALSLEELANLTITSVSRRKENLADAMASVYVITADDIRRSGATTLPEALRLAPNLQVAQLDPVQFAITARGFNNAVGNKLLVLIDGRTVYTPLFSGVFWEMQDTLLQDIDRIEVISGPGATLWGANAVNGVINILTRRVAETQGVLAAGQAGTREDGIFGRIAGRAGDTGPAVRLYAKARNWDNSRYENATPARNSWQRRQVGFRADWGEEGDGFTLQGDAYQGESENRSLPVLALPPHNVSGANVLARWEKLASDGGELRVQGYWDHSERDEAFLFSPTADIIDLDVQYGRALARHYVTGGGGYRQARDEVADGMFTRYIPDSRTLTWRNAFIHDQWEVNERVRAEFGLKLEWNEFTGTEYLPSARLSWKPAADHLLWTGWSRAVRAPSRFDRDVYLPKVPPFIVAGGPNFQAEVARVAELGYRGQITPALNATVTVFGHRWRRLRSGTLPPFPVYLANGIEGDAYGVEGWANWQVLPRWKLAFGLNTLRKNLRFRPGLGDTVGVDNETLHNDPDYQWQVRSSLNLGRTVKADLFLRRVAALEVEPVPAYTELNGRLAWEPVPDLELSLTGRNLLEKDHAEFGDVASRALVERSILVGFRWSR